MTTIKVDKITPGSGTTTTLGDSGDTFTIPAGVTFTNSGSTNMAIKLLIAQLQSQLLLQQLQTKVIL